MFTSVTLFHCVGIDLGLPRIEETYLRIPEKTATCYRRRLIYSGSSYIIFYHLLSYNILQRRIRRNVLAARPLASRIGMHVKNSKNQRKKERTC